MPTLNPGDEKSYPKGTTHEAARVHFSHKYQINVGRVVIREDGGGIYCSEMEITDGGQVRQFRCGDVPGDGDSGDSGEPACAGDNEMMT